MPAKGVVYAGSAGSAGLSAVFPTRPLDFIWRGANNGVMVRGRNPGPGPEPRAAPTTGVEKMHRIILLGVLVAAGCQNVVGPFQQRDPQRVDDPLLPIYEQQQR